MSGMKNTSYKLISLSTALVFILISMISPLINKAGAADLISRNITIGDSFPSVVTTHSFAFTTATGSNVGSVQFEYCTNSPFVGTPCTAPAGLNVTSAGIVTQTGISGFSVSGISTNNNLVLTRAPAFSAPVSANYVFSNVVNPSTSNQTIYVRISTYDNINMTGSRIDNGSVVFVVDDRFNIDLYVPPYMTFCVAVNVAINCSSTTGFLSNFGEFSEFSPTTATSQFSVATNDPSGYNTFINGQTMTSGTNIIPPLAILSNSSPGTSQFGINLRANNSPSVGANPDGSGGGAVSANYNVQNQFRFVDGERIAGSATTTDHNRYTVSYLINVSDTQAPGVYATTLTYTSIASF